MDKIETREARIIFQNALAHAVKLMIHNNKESAVDVADVIDLAKVIAREVVKIGSK